jgi:hypothetical protein
LRCGDNFLPRIGNIEAFGAGGLAHLGVSIEANDAAAIFSATAAISSATAANEAATQFAGAARSDPTQNRPTN